MSSVTLGGGIGLNWSAQFRRVERDAVLGTYR